MISLPKYEAYLLINKRGQRAHQWAARLASANTVTVLSAVITLGVQQTATSGLDQERLPSDLEKEVAKRIQTGLTALITNALNDLDAAETAALLDAEAEIQQVVDAITAAKG